MMEDLLDTLKQASLTGYYNVGKSGVDSSVGRAYGQCLGGLAACLTAQQMKAWPSIWTSSGKGRFAREFLEDVGWISNRASHEKHNFGV